MPTLTSPTTATSCPSPLHANMANNNGATTSSSSSAVTTPSTPSPRHTVTNTSTPLPAGTEVVARYSFKGNSPEDLAFQKGDILTIMTPTTDPNWYKARHVDGRIGLVPHNYIQTRSEVKLNAMPWFHGKITREDAETLLRPRDVSTSRITTTFP